MVDLSLWVKDPEPFMWRRDHWNRYGKLAVEKLTLYLIDHMPAAPERLLVWRYSERDGPIACTPCYRVADAAFECYQQSAMFRDTVGIVVTDEDCREIYVFRDAAEPWEDGHDPEPVAPSDSIFCCA